MLLGKVIQYNHQNLHFGLISSKNSYLKEKTWVRWLTDFFQVVFVRKNLSIVFLCALSEYDQYFFRNLKKIFMGEGPIYN